MRLRNKPWAKDKLQQFSNYVIHEPEQFRGKWGEAFEKNQPVHIEIGTGKGQFITGMAKANPEINYIGIELQESVIVSALDRLIEAELPNCKLMNVNGAELAKYFASGDVSQVYLNFSDPWPKTRHEKRRLTFKSFLEVYESILVKNGEIHFKTDNQGLFEYSLVSFSHYGMLLKYVSLDLHNSDYEGNIMTEYEEKFSSRGSRIYRCEVQFQSK
ncbi:tRNA (guanosine(46)-N7)-methyltransferase TrmB [Mesobacillus subterraneus]|jgi:tRNA (guanine-N7-)-methyltransferase|uniref:tRNA (guanosine(46)-N7)-methyltransferase TrmB n=1 Tax=Mesobacillus subterraneus TaxID=285983 RepID=UPI00203FDEDD|nr:tRNA (guanosine(46)-N7)-methyltransferase TrmB [Mesobacillus subterraneus]MCM3666003.1 tRNA (guanosine(46)-N7)-methyltransferase TrmB [Mesobacillus subterraneus]MCM3684886.1 tRNA (guanosine(46)-N7)-methyltransferase TrmB [Mesobacillus subterraneus]